MATSGVISGLMTARDIVTAALQDLAVIAGNEVPNANDMALGIRHLNWMLKEWMADGCNLWREFEDAVVIPANTASVTLDPRVVDVLEMRRVISSTNEMSLSRWERADYDCLPNKIAQGAPTCFVPLKLRDTYEVRFWMVPTVDTTIKYTAARVIEDVADEDDNVDAPQEWTSTIVANLAARLMPAFGEQFQNVQTVRLAAQLYQQMRAYDRPASYFMGTYEYGY
jgi:hypothetical protein